MFILRRNCRHNFPVDNYFLDSRDCSSQNAHLYEQIQLLLFDINTYIKKTIQL